ncbi:MAG: gamma-glutamyltransferase family protein [Candidatus Hydrogenedentes bacterium]|nr:gamma-glutamyltransferase family protein [Candidatus Hydrogenedentota bacterium]
MQINEKALENRNRNRSTVACRHGIVCASQPLATLAGIDMLRSGGTAIDAAICANAVLSVVEPMNCGPGGDLFAILWSEKDKKLYGLNASGRAPYDWNLKRARKLGLKSIPSNSPLAWNVPGCVSGWALLHERFGGKKFADVLAPAITYAREGFPVSPIIASDWPFDPAKYPTLAKTFMPQGHAPRFGEIFTNPDMAHSLELIAQSGGGAFYKGEIAQKLARYSRKNGGYLAERDLQEHSATLVEPVSTSYRGYDVWEIPPNGQGISVLQILNMLEQFNIGALEPNSAEHLHLFIEAKKLAYEDRAVFYADMDFADVPLSWLVSKDYGKQRAKLINPGRASDKVMPGDASGGKDTIYLTAADDAGNMISLIQSNYAGWGSRLVPDGLGFSIQNRGESFSLDPKHRNRLEPHKRPFHTIIPAFVTKDGNPIFSFGVMGGDFQPQGHSQVLMNLIDFGMSPQQAGEQPRVEHSGSSSPRGSKMPAGGAIRFELGFPEAVMHKLAEMGHTVRPGFDVFGGYQGIWREENPRRYFGGSDPRKDGCAIGF